MDGIERMFEMLNLQKIISFWAILIFCNLRSFSADYFYNIKIMGHLNVS